VWSYDFIHDHTRDGKGLRFLTVLDEYTRENLAIISSRKLKSLDVLECLSDLFLERGCPDYIRSDNGPEFIANELRSWLKRLGVKTLFIEPGSPWEMDILSPSMANSATSFLLWNCSTVCSRRVY